MSVAIGQRVRAERERLGLSQADLARASGLTQQAISKLERGGSSGSPAIVLLAQILHVRPEWLFSGRGRREAGPVPSEAERVAAAYATLSEPDRVVIKRFLTAVFPDWDDAEKKS